MRRKHAYFYKRKTEIAGVRNYCGPFLFLSVSAFPLFSSLASYSQTFSFPSIPFYSSPFPFSAWSSHKAFSCMLCFSHSSFGQLISLPKIIEIVAIECQILNLNAPSSTLARARWERLQRYRGRIFNRDVQRLSKIIFKNVWRRPRRSWPLSSRHAQSCTICA